MEEASQILSAYLHINRLMNERLRGQIGKRSLTFPQTMALVLLHQEGPMTISNLATASGSANSTISGVVDRLERMGLTRRVRSEQDRRVIYVTTTEQFEQLYQSAATDALGRFASLLGRLGREEQAQVLRGLRILEGALIGAE